MTPSKLPDTGNYEGQHIAIQHCPMTYMSLTETGLLKRINEKRKWPKSMASGELFTDSVNFGSGMLCLACAFKIYFRNSQ